MSDVKDKWERIQQKTFQGWINSHLRKRGVVIKDLFTDLQDGLNLAALLSIISEEDFPYKLEKKIRLKIQKIGNVNYCLKFIAEHDVKLASIGAEEIVDGNEKLTLGMIWTIILRWQIADISEEELSAKEALLLWCQKKTEPYDNVNVKNFHMSFQDGLALCALIHRHRPDLIPNYHELSPENKKENLNLAFEIAEKHLDVPQLLDADDIVDLPKPDERSIITYVSMYYHVFSQGQKAEVAARRIGKVIDFTEANDKTKQEFQSRASDLSKWIADKTEQLNDRTFDDTLSGVKQKIDEFQGYKTSEKPPKAAERYELEAFYNALQTNLKMNKRAAYVAPEGCSPAELDAAWGGLEKAEQERNLALLAELRRMKKVEALRNKFDEKATRLENWIGNKQSAIEGAPLGDTISAVNANIRNNEAQRSEITAHDRKRSALKTIASDLAEQRYPQIDQVNDRVGAIDGSWDTLNGAVDSRKAALEAELKRLQDIEAIQTDFTKRAMQMDAWLEDADELLTETIDVDTVEEIESINAALEQFKGEYVEKQGEYDGLAGVMSETPNADALSPIPWSSLESRWNNLSGQIDSRAAQLGEETTKQTGREDLRVAFADAAKAFNEFAEGLSGEISGLEGTPQEQQQALSGLSQKKADNTGLYDAAAAAHTAMQDAEVLDNPHTNSTFESIQQKWNALQMLLSKKGDAVDGQIAAEQHAGVSQEQLAEFKECFSHFDKDGDNLLSRLEFGGCLRALGQELSLEEKGGELDKLLAAIDADGDGKVTFDEFVEHMTKVSTDSDTPDQIKDAFHVIAGEKDFITEADLNRYLSPDQVKYCIARMPKNDNGYDYKKFTDELYA